MKIKNYKIIDNDIVIYGRGKSIKQENFNSLFNDDELIKIREDFMNNRIDNYLLNPWEVIYYIVLKYENKKALTFSINEYDILYKYLAYST
jgi:hypothetical protein